MKTEMNANPQAASPDTLAGLFKACFPGIERGTGTVLSLLSDSSNRVLTREIDGITAAAAVWRENTALMLCVLPEYRGRGLGSALLSEMEEDARRGGAEEFRFCDGPGYLAPGIPIGKGYEKNAAFFEKRGYKHTWGDEECVDMDLDLRDASFRGARPGDRRDGILYCFAGDGDRDAVVACAEDGHEKFARYYRDPALYRPDSPRRVLAAFPDGGASPTAAGALIIYEEEATEEPGLGSVGCTVVRHAYRNRGIATTMVRAGTEHLRSIGLRRAFLGYTYTAIVPMYARSGYGICMKYLMGAKKLV